MTSEGSVVRVEMAAVGGSGSMRNNAITAASILATDSDLHRRHTDLHQQPMVLSALSSVERYGSTPIVDDAVNRFHSLDTRIYTSSW